MLAGFYTAASGILVQQRNLNEIGNNITNSQTVGYRTRRVVQSTFEHNLLTRFEHNKYNKIGEGDPCSLVDVVETNFDPNSLKETDWPYDMALVGDGFFNVQGAERREAVSLPDEKRGLPSGGRPGDLPEIAHGREAPCSSRRENVGAVPLGGQLCLSRPGAAFEAALRRAAGAEGPAVLPPVLHAVHHAGERGGVLRDRL